jgi:uncharacterized protein (DUF58 family)
MTGRGWAILAATVVSLAAGRLLGLEDLYLVGAGLAVVLIGAMVYVTFARPGLDATRRVLPARVHAGTSSRVELSLVNRRLRRSPVLAVRDPFDYGARWARFLVAPLAPGEVARAAYRLPTEDRGVFELGPLTVSLSDPFGLVATEVDAAPRTRLTVYPRIDTVAPPPSSNGDDPLAGADHPRALTGGGEDFYALRPYVRGDDLRKVHWPSTARTDELMIRQDEMSWQSRSTILLDNRQSSCPPAALEILVSAAASLVVAAARHDGLQRLLTTGGYDSRSVGGTGHVDAILEHLAGIRAGPGALVPVLGTIRRSQVGGALVVLTTGLAVDSDIHAVAALATRLGSVTLVVAEASSWGEPGRERPLPGALRAVRVTAAEPFAVAWSHMAGPTTGRGRPSRRWGVVGSQG